MINYKELKANYEAAKKAYVDGVKDAIREEAEKLFSLYSDIDTISFAVKSSEYDDEGMYPGVHGPVINYEDTDRYYPDWTYGRGDSDDARLKDLRVMLNDVGELILCDIFDDETIVTITNPTRKAFFSEKRLGY